MKEELDPASQLATIRQMMERSSRFISLSGLSGVSAGICALIGAALAYPYVYGTKNLFFAHSDFGRILGGKFPVMNTALFWIGVGTFLAAFLSAFLFTWNKSRQQGIPLWGRTARQLLIYVSIPMVAGGIFLLKMLDFGEYHLFAPGCLLFYGLALINASRYTLQEIKYLGGLQVLLSLINLFFLDCSLYFWALGFGILHIFYGIYMWNKYEREIKKEF